jgi:hypothetical protein
MEQSLNTALSMAERLESELMGAKGAVDTSASILEVRWHNKMQKTENKVRDEEEG